MGTVRPVSLGVCAAGLANVVWTQQDGANRELDDSFFDAAKNFQFRVGRFAINPMARSGSQNPLEQRCTLVDTIHAPSVLYGVRIVNIILRQSLSPEEFRHHLHL